MYLDKISMFRDLPVEIAQLILSCLSIREQARLTRVSRDTSRLIANNENYNLISRSRGLPRIVGGQNLRHPSNYHDILSEAQTEKFTHLIYCALEAEDHEWIRNNGVDLIISWDRDENHIAVCKVLGFLIRNNDIESVKKIQKLRCYMWSFDSSMLCNKSINVETYAYMSTNNFRETIETELVTAIAACGNSEVVSYICDTFPEVDHSRVLAGYLIGGRTELYGEHLAKHGVKGTFESSDIHLCIQHGNLEVLKRVLETALPSKDPLHAFIPPFGGVYDMVSYPRSYTDDMFDFALSATKSRFHECSVIIDALACGNHKFLKRFLTLSDIYCDPDYTRYSTLIKMARIPMFRDLEQYRESVKIALDFFRLFQRHAPYFNKTCLLEEAQKQGNLELSDILRDM